MPASADPMSLRQDRPVSIFDDLEAEQDRIEQILAGLDNAAWDSPSEAAGWSVADVVLHLAQTEEAVVATVRSGRSLTEARPHGAAGETSVDAAMEQLVAAERNAPTKTFERWRAARRAAV